MKYQICPRASLLTLIILVSNWLSVEAQTCNPSGKIIGRNPPRDQCNQENQSESVAKEESFTKLTNVHHRFLSVQKQPWLSTASRKVVMVEHHPSVMINTIQITPRSWHCQLDGSVIGRGAWTTLPSMVMEEVSRPGLLMSVIPQWDVILIMIISLHVLTILSMPHASKAVWNAGKRLGWTGSTLVWCLNETCMQHKFQ